MIASECLDWPEIPAATGVLASPPGSLARLMSRAGGFLRPHCAVILLASACCALTVPLMVSSRTIFRNDHGMFDGPRRIYVGRSLRRGEIPWWTHASLNGFRMQAAKGAAVFYPLTLVYAAIPSEAAHDVFYALHVVVGGIGMLYFLRIRGLPDWICGVGSVNFVALLSRLCEQVPQDPMLMAWAPWTLLFIERAARGQVNAGWLLAGVNALTMLTGSVDAMLPYFVLQILYIPLSGACRRPTMALRLAAQALGVGALLGAVQLLPTLELVLNSTRAGGASHLLRSDTYLPSEHFRQHALATLFAFLPAMLWRPYRLYGVACGLMYLFFKQAAVEGRVSHFVHRLPGFHWSQWPINNDLPAQFLAVILSMLGMAGLWAAAGHWFRGRLRTASLAAIAATTTALVSWHCGEQALRSYEQGSSTFYERGTPLANYLRNSPGFVRLLSTVDAYDGLTNGDLADLKSLEALELNARHLPAAYHNAFEVPVVGLFSEATTALPGRIGVMDNLARRQLLPQVLIAAGVTHIATRWPLTDLRNGAPPRGSWRSHGKIGQRPEIEFVDEDGLIVRKPARAVRETDPHIALERLCVRAGQRVHVEFRIRGDQTGKVGLLIGKATPLYERTSEYRELEVGQQWATYALQLINGDHASPGRIVWRLTEAPAKLEIDQVRIESAEGRLGAWTDGFLTPLPDAPVPLARVTDSPGRAWMVFRTRPAAEPDAQLEALCEPDFDPRRTAIVEREMRLDAAPSDRPQVHVNGTLKDVTVELSTASRGLLVLSDRFDPNLRALVDGRPTPLERVNYAYCGVEVSPGSHVVHVYYRPLFGRLGLAISASTALAVGLCMFRNRFARRPPVR